MKALVIYDSIYGNTQSIARSIGKALGPREDVETVKVSDVKEQQIAETDLLVVGSPTRAFRPTRPVSDFLKKLPANAIRGLKVAAFDTRISLTDITSPVLRRFLGLFGYASQPIANGLRKKGGELIMPPEGFFVEASEGPLKDGELLRAEQWARQIANRL